MDQDNGAVIIDGSGEAEYAKEVVDSESLIQSEWCVKNPPELLATSLQKMDDGQEYSLDLSTVTEPGPPRQEFTVMAKPEEWVNDDWTEHVAEAAAYDDGLEEDINYYEEEDEDDDEDQDEFFEDGEKKSRTIDLEKVHDAWVREATRKPGPVKVIDKQYLLNTGRMLKKQQPCDLEQDEMDNLTDMVNSVRSIVESINTIMDLVSFFQDPKHLFSCFDSTVEDLKYSKFCRKYAEFQDLLFFIAAEKYCKVDDKDFCSALKKLSSAMYGMFKSLTVRVSMEHGIDALMSKVDFAVSFILMDKVITGSIECRQNPSKPEFYRVLKTSHQVLEWLQKTLRGVATMMVSEIAQEFSSFKCKEKSWMIKEEKMRMFKKQEKEEKLKKEQETESIMDSVGEESVLERKEQEFALELAKRLDQLDKLK